MQSQPTSSGETRQLCRASFAETIDALRGAGFKPTRSGSGDFPFRSRCPGHNGANPQSLAIGEYQDGAPRLHCHAQDCDRRAILQPIGLWFDRQLTGARPVRRPAPAETKPHEAEAKPSATSILAAAIIADALDATDTPAHAYLAGRLAWPRVGRPLPASVRWLPANAAPKGVHLPATAAGAAVYLFAAPGATADAVQVEALQGDGRHAPWTPRRGRWRCGYGTRKGRQFEAAPSEGPESPTVLVEGPVTALAASWCHPGARCLAMGGHDFANYTPDGSPIVIESDGDPAGHKAALDALEVFPDALLVDRETGDVADELAGDLGERAGIVEFDGGMGRAQAERIAWRDLGVAL